MAFAAQEERDDEVDGGSDEIDDGSGDDHDADGGDSTDNDVWDWTKGTDEISVDPNDYSNDTQTKKADEIVAFAAQEELDDEVDDCADEVDDVSSDDHEADDKDSSDDDSSTSDSDPNGDDADGSVDDISVDDIFITTDSDDELDENGDDGYGRRLGIWLSQNYANHAFVLHLVSQIDAARRDKAFWDDFDDQNRKNNETQEQDELDRDARIASNAPSEADRNILENRRTRSCREYARALLVRADRSDDSLLRESDEDYRVNAEAFDSFIREHEELNARAKKECSAREANGEDARDVRARWEQFERYGCCGALDDAFFDPRNG